jgi:hypothetical protein
MRPNKPLEWSGPLRFAAYALQFLPATQGQRYADKEPRSTVDGIQ